MMDMHLQIWKMIISSRRHLMHCLISWINFLSDNVRIKMNSENFCIQIVCFDGACNTVRDAW